MTSDRTWLSKSDEGSHVIQSRTLIGPFLALTGILLEWAGPTDKLNPRTIPEQELSSLLDTITQRLTICRVSGL